MIVSSPSYSKGAFPSLATHPVLQFPWPLTVAASPGSGTDNNVMLTSKQAIPNKKLNLVIRFKLRCNFIVSFPILINMILDNIKTGLVGRFRYSLPIDLSARMDR
jgi:hypothetical protein